MFIRLLLGFIEKKCSHTCIYIQTHTHTYLIRETGPPCPLFLSECAQDWRGLWQILCKKKKTFFPSLLFFLFCHPLLSIPPSGPSLFGSFHPLICPPAPHFVHSGMTQHTPHPTLEPPFPLMWVRWDAAAVRDRSHLCPAHSVPLNPNPLYIHDI